MGHDKILAFLDGIIAANGNRAYLTEQEFYFMKCESFTFVRNLKEIAFGTGHDPDQLGYYKHLELWLDKTNE